MPFPFPRLLVRSLACLSLFAFAPLPALADLQSVLQRERTELAEMCGATMQFLEGFAREVNVDGNGAPDILVDYGQLSCDGTRMMFCGSAGCTQKIYLGRADGSHAMAAEFLAYELRFDRPSEGTFLAVLHGGSCGRAGAETGFKRYALTGGTITALPEEPRDRWSFAPAPVPSAMLATSDGDSLRLVCDGAALRIQYGPTWMWEENGSVSQHARDLAGAQDRLEIEIEVDGGQPTAVSFHDRGDGPRPAVADACPGPAVLCRAHAGELRRASPRRFAGALAQLHAQGIFAGGRQSAAGLRPGMKTE